MRAANDRQLLHGPAIVLVAAFSSPLAAAEWMVIGAEPEPAPHRSLYVMAAEDAWIFERFADGFDKTQANRSPDLSAMLAQNTINSVFVYQVFEDAGGTNFISYSLDFKCQQGLVSIPEAVSYDRAGKTEKGGAPGWMKVPDNWIGRAEMIACRWSDWQEAQQAWKGVSAPTNKRKKASKAAPTFASLGMEYLGKANFFDTKAIVDLVWNTRWGDAVQPAYYEGTAEEKAAVAAKLTALREQTRGVLNEGSKWAEIAIKLADKAERMGDKFASDMAGVGGMTEAEVIARWGAPASSIDSGGVRTLTYYFSDTQYGVANNRVDILGAGGQVAQTYELGVTSSSRQCSRTLHLEEGGVGEKAYRVFDFSIGC
jgi:hypothetical protein